MSGHLFHSLIFLIFFCLPDFPSKPQKNNKQEIQEGKSAEVIRHAWSILSRAEIISKNLSIISLCPENQRPLAIHISANIFNTLSC